jgi:hypothetical protein
MDFLARISRVGSLIDEFLGNNNSENSVTESASSPEYSLPAQKVWAEAMKGKENQK